MQICVKKKNKPRKRGGACHIGGGRGKRGAVLHRVVGTGLTGKVAWLRDVRAGSTQL